MKQSQGESPPHTYCARPSKAPQVCPGIPTHTYGETIKKGKGKSSHLELYHSPALRLKTTNGN